MAWAPRLPAPARSQPAPDRLLLPIWRSGEVRQWVRALVGEGGLAPSGACDAHDHRVGTAAAILKKIVEVNIVSHLTIFS